MKRERRKFSTAFKATLQQISSKYGVHANQIAQWKCEFLEQAEDIFSKKRDQDKKLGAIVIMHLEKELHTAPS